MVLCDDCDHGMRYTNTVGQAEPEQKIGVEYVAVGHIKGLSGGLVCNLTIS